MSQPNKCNDISQNSISFEQFARNKLPSYPHSNSISFPLFNDFENSDFAVGGDSDDESEGFVTFAEMMDIQTRSKQHSEEATSASGARNKQIQREQQIIFENGVDQGAVCQGCFTGECEII